MFLFFYEPDGALLQRLDALPLHHVKMLRVVCKHMRAAVRKILRQKLAVQRIEKFWSLQLPANTSRFLADSFLNLNLGETHVRAMGFDQLIVYLRDTDVIQTSKKFLLRINFAATKIALQGMNGNQGALVTVSVREILAAVMIAYFPHDVFQNFGEREMSAINASRPLLDCMHRMATALATGKGFTMVAPADIQQFPDLHRSYLESFRAWKVPDLQNLVQRIEHALVALVNSLAQVDPFEPLDEPLRAELRTQIRRLLENLRKYGPANLEAFEQIRRTVIPWETLDEHNPFDMEAWNNRAV